ncbi:MAG: serine hydrolase [Verrucomicrobia bacterium]|nr:serine hydrolase [Verrucomicrobiota bacterium]
MKLRTLAIALSCIIAGLPALALDLTSLRAAAAYSAAHRGVSMLVMQNGRRVFEDYPNGHSADEPHKIYSGTKAFWNLCALAATEDGLLSLDERVGDSVPEWNADARKSRITVRQLLDFSCGLDPGFPLHRDDPGDRNRIALQLPLVASPGQAFIYGPSALQVFHEVLKRKLSARGQTPTGYLEGRVLRPLGLGAQRYMADSAGNPLLASGWKLTAREWAKMGQVALNGGAPVLSRVPLSISLRGSPVNRAFAFGWWNNRAAPGGREFDIEDMLEPKWFRQDWRSTAISRGAPADLMASIGSGYQRLFVIPSMSLVVVRQGLGGKFSDSEYLRLLLGK